MHSTKTYNIRCGICGKLLDVDDNIKFFAEDGSYVCKECCEYNQNEIMIETGEYQIDKVIKYFLS